MGFLIVNFAFQIDKCAISSQDQCWPIHILLFFICTPVKKSGIFIHMEKIHYAFCLCAPVSYRQTHPELIEL